MVPRHATATLLQLARGFPVLAITGPRQSGKTTLARSAFPDLPYVNLEDPDTRELALTDPRRFLARHAGGAILDEVQRAPALMSYLLGVADAAPDMGRWVLTGSQQFGLLDGIAQSLAGRAGMLTLLPLAHSELAAEAGIVTLEERLWRGGYPALHAGHRRPAAAALVCGLRGHLPGARRPAAAQRGQPDDLPAFPRHVRGAQRPVAQPQQPGLRLRHQPAHRATVAHGAAGQPLS